MKKHSHTKPSKPSQKLRRKRQLLFLLGPTGAALAALILFLIIKAVTPSHTLHPASKLTPTPVEKESETSRFSEPVSLTVSMLGDCTLGTDANFNYSTSLNAYYDLYGPSYFFQNVKSILEKDDLTIANFEGTLTTSETREEKQFAFKGPLEYTSILTEGSVEAVNLANNHSRDYGEQSYIDTKQALSDAEITPFGYNTTALLDIKGIKVGLVGIYELHDHLERKHQLLVNIQKVQAEGADLVFVVFHWGNEKDTVPDSNQITLAKLAIDNGADLVVGHHSHVLQGVADYQGKTIAYGLGNFCFGGNSSPSDMDTMIFQQTFTIHPDGSKTSSDPNLIPCRISSDPYVNNYQPSVAEGAEAERILNKIKERTDAISPS